MHGLIRSANETDLAHRLQILEIRNRLLDPGRFTPFAPLEISDELSRGITDSRIVPLLSKQLILQPGNTGLMETYINHQMDRKARNVRFAGERYPNALHYAQELIDLIQQEYHIK